LSKAILAWLFIKDKRPSRSEILDKYSAHRQEEGGSSESSSVAGDKLQSWLGDPPVRAGWKDKRKERKMTKNLAKHDIS
jgi:hypothetical protein